MEKLIKFIGEHSGDDISRLILDRKKYPDIDIDLAVNCIESRRKLKGKVLEWYQEPGLIFPAKLSAEQCSSSATGCYKAKLAESIATGFRSDGDKSGWTLVDLTGGLGVDSWFFSKKADKVVYNEMQTALCDAARHNFKILQSDNIEIVNSMVSKGACLNSLGSLNPAEGNCPDIIYMDPARRGEGGKKVFLIEDCTPDVLTIKEELFKYSRNLLIKLSPMADITMVCNRLGHNCREVHVVATGGECKELLIWIDREWNAEYIVTAVELHGENQASTFSFNPSEERKETVGFKSDSQDRYLFEPGKALMKAGAFNLIGSRFGISKMGVSTHYYTTDCEKTASILKDYGKVYEILERHNLDKRSIKALGNKYPKAEVSARNIPMDTDTLKKKLGITSGDDAHIFGLKSDSEGNILIAAKRIL